MAGKGSWPPFESGTGPTTPLGHSPGILWAERQEEAPPRDGREPDMVHAN